MGYFPSDITFMSDEERKENGIKIPKDLDITRVYIYKLDLNVEKPVIEKIPAIIRTGVRGDDEVIHWVGPNEYKVWYSEFDTKMLGVVYEPLDNVIELIVKRDKKESESITMIEDYCCKKAACMRKKLYMFYRGVGAAIQFMVFKTTKVKPIQVQASGPLLGTHATTVIIDDFDPPEIPPISREEYLKKASFSAPIDVTDDQFDGGENV